MENEHEFVKRNAEFLRNLKLQPHELRKKFSHVPDEIYDYIQFSLSRENAILCLMSEKWWSSLPNTLDFSRYKVRKAGNNLGKAFIIEFKKCKEAIENAFKKVA